MSEFEQDIVIGEELESPLAEKLRNFALQNRTDATVKTIFSDELEKQDIIANPRKFMDDSALQWLNVRIYKIKKEEALDKPKSWMQTLDSILIERDDRDKLIERLFKKAGLDTGKSNKAIREYGYRVFAEPNHPTKDFLYDLPGQWRLGLEAYVALDLLLNLYGYDFDKTKGLGTLLVEANNNPKNKDSKGHMHTQALVEVLGSWYKARKS